MNTSNASQNDEIETLNALLAGCEWTTGLCMVPQCEPSNSDAAQDSDTAVVR